MSGSGISIFAGIDLTSLLDWKHIILLICTQLLICTYLFEYLYTRIHINYFFSVYFNKEHL